MVYWSLPSKTLLLLTCFDQGFLIKKLKNMVEYKVKLRKGTLDRYWHVWFHNNDIIFEWFNWWIIWIVLTMSGNKCEYYNFTSSDWSFILFTVHSINYDYALKKMLFCNIYSTSAIQFFLFHKSDKTVTLFFMFAVKLSTNS